MFGEYDEKFSMMRAYLTFMMTLPGKKLLFMGTEYAQIREWDFENQLEWFMLKYPRHTEMQRFVRELNNLYLERSELWEIDDSWSGFSWIDADRANDNTVIYERYDTKGKSLTVVVNFSPEDRKGYEFDVSRAGKYEVLLNSDLYRFGGRNINDADAYEVRTQKIKTDDGCRVRKYLKFDLPAYTGLILRRAPVKRKNSSPEGK